MTEIPTAPVPARQMRCPCCGAQFGWMRLVPGFNAGACAPTADQGAGAPDAAIPPAAPDPAPPTDDEILEAAQEAMFRCIVDAGVGASLIHEYARAELFYAINYRMPLRRMNTRFVEALRAKLVRERRP